MNTKTFTTLSVGEKFPTNVQIPHGQDMIASLEMYFTDEGDTAQLFLIQSIPNITQQEKMILEREKVHTRVYKREDQSLFYFRYGNTPMILESTLDASLYEKSGSIENVTQVKLSNILTIVRVNPATNCIESLRAASLPKKFRERIEQAITDSVSTSTYTDKYKDWIGMLWSKYNTMQLWSIAEATGKIGE